MKLATNKSRWATDDLRAVLRACATHHGVSLRGLSVAFESAKVSSGRYTYSNGADGRPQWVTFRLPVPERYPLIDRLGALDQPDGAGAAPGFKCELGYLVDYFIRVQFKSEPKTSIGLRTNKLPVWWGDLNVTTAEKIKRPRLVGVDLQTTRIAKARELLAKWEKNLKKAQNKVKKYAREIKRRERVLDDMTPRRFGPR